MSKMQNGGTQDAGNSSFLPPPPSIPPNLKPERVESTKHSIISRRGLGTDGELISLVSNHFKVSVRHPDQIFHQYTVSFTSGDKKIVEGKGIGRKIINKLCQTYPSDIDGRRSAYDGEKSFYTVHKLAQKTFTVVLEETFAKRDYGSPSKIGKRSKRTFPSKTYNVVLTHVAQIPLEPIAIVLQGNAVDNTQDALRVLDTVLRQQAANSGCLLVRQSFFQARNLADIGGGVTSCRGFYSSFRTIQGGLSLNMDVSTTMIVNPGPVINFLLAQDARGLSKIDWGRAKRRLENLRVKATHSSMEFKIIGLSDKPCNQQFFPMKVKTGDSSNDGRQTVDITVYEYFRQHRQIELSWSAYLPCLDVGRPNHPIYLPLELASLVSLQRYTKALSAEQRASLVEQSRQNPRERKCTLIDAVEECRYDDDPVLVACGVKINTEMIQVDGRVLVAPNLKVGNKEDCIPCNGRWNFNKKKLFTPACHIEHWVVVNFSTRCNIRSLSKELITCGRNKGIHMEQPLDWIEEDQLDRTSGPVERVDMMIKQIKNKRAISRLQFILCVLPVRKNSDIYGPWKKECLTKIGIVNQCISPLKINDQILTNVLLKINSKLGGINSLLAVEEPSQIPFLKDTPTMIIGMDVFHGTPQTDVPSIAAVVGSLSWPLISRYRASVRTQSLKVKMIDSLYKPSANGKVDDGIMSELFRGFLQSSSGQKPEQIIVFRNGVSESQFNQVLNFELEQIVKAYQHAFGDVPKFTVIVAQKNHHTKLFRAKGSGNVPPGTVVDTEIVHPRNYDFYMCAQAGMIGTSRPTHYHVLLDEIGFTPDDLQNLIHSLSYVYQRSTTAISIVAPIRYAHLAAAQVAQFINYEDFSDTSSGHAGNMPVPELPRLHSNVRDSMFFC